MLETLFQNRQFYSGRWWDVQQGYNNYIRSLDHVNIFRKYTQIGHQEGHSERGQKVFIRRPSQLGHQNTLNFRIGYFFA